MARAEVSYHTRPHDERSSVFSGSLWMVGISLALFFLPAINGFVGGLVGGYKVGGSGRALTAAILPAIVVGLGLWLLLAVLEAPVIGFLSGIALIGLIVFSSLGLLLGAAIGGAVSDKPRST
jgi:hypothetical protein